MGNSEHQTVEHILLQTADPPRGRRQHNDTVARNNKRLTMDASDAAAKRCRPRSWLDLGGAHSRYVLPGRADREHQQQLPAMRPATHACMVTKQP